MTWQVSLALRIYEAIQVVTSLGALLINGITLKEAIATRRHVLMSKMNHGSDVWSLTSLRGKMAFVAVQILSCAMSIDRFRLLLNGYVPDYIARWLAFGTARTLMSVLVAWTAWANMRAFATLKAEEMKRT